MKSVKWALGLLCVCLALSVPSAEHFGGHEASKAFSMKGKRCYMKLFPSNEFQGNHVTLRKSRRFLRHSERSLRTVGECCWRIYQWVAFFTFVTLLWQWFTLNFVAGGLNIAASEPPSEETRIWAAPGDGTGGGVKSDRPGRPIVDLSHHGNGNITNLS